MFRKNQIFAEKDVIKRSRTKVLLLKMLELFIKLAKNTSNVRQFFLSLKNSLKS
jgi:hypothetical protein